MPTVQLHRLKKTQKPRPINNASLPPRTSCYRPFSCLPFEISGSTGVELACARPSGESPVVLSLLQLRASESTSEHNLAVRVFSLDKGVCVCVCRDAC